MDDVQWSKLRIGYVDPVVVYNGEGGAALMKKWVRKYVSKM